jgi:hypothetical protein
MNYAAPLAYATRSLPYDPYAPMVGSHHPRPSRQRRRRMRMMLLPALRPRRREATVQPTLVTDGSR